MSALPLDQSIRDAIARLHDAMAKVANGDVAAIKALYTHTDEATSFYGWGGYEKGWEGVSRRWDWAARQFQGGSVRYESVSVVVGADMFLATDIETYENQRMAGVEGLTGWTNRVTHVFRRENGEWRLVHRHGNRLETQFTPSTRLQPADRR
ncbi:MAG: nuclear transport factor 2 family protein [Hyphomicrobiaceae bacterium]